MEKPINPAWLEPFRKTSEMAAVDYQNGFSPPLPRRTALNRLTRLQAAGWLSRIGEGRSTLYRLTATADSHLASSSPRQAISPFPAPSQDAIRSVIRGAIGEPDPFRVLYRQAIADQVADIIRARCTRPQAAARLRSWAETSVIQADRMKFVTAVEETLSGIHEGNFARYRVRPSEFESWQIAWKSAQPS